MKWLIGTVLAAAFAGLITWAIVGMNRWERACHDQGGTVETRFEGFITIYSGNPPMPQMTPQYSYHCWVGGREVSV